MKAFLFGFHWINAGPSNVNRKLIWAADKQVSEDTADNQLLYLKSNNKYVRLFEATKKIHDCDVIILSGLCSPRNFSLIKSSKKPVVYLMHGDVRYENHVNHQNTSEKVLQTQDEILHIASRIVCVSENYKSWVSVRYPKYEEKITFVNNGLILNRRPRVCKVPYSIAVAGGNRPIKANKYVCAAVSILQSQGIPCKLYVFGRHYPSCEDLPNIDGLEYMGQLDELDYYEKLDKISMFVMNSDVEPFGLTIADAINCNCSMLMSSNIGAASILSMQDIDIISNNHDPQEIARKVLAIEKCPNIDRLYSSIDLSSVSVESSYQRLMHICEEVII